jgi:hypothetical protein
MRVRRRYRPKDDEADAYNRTNDPCDQVETTQGVKGVNRAGWIAIGHGQLWAAANDHGNRRPQPPQLSVLS